MPAVCSSTFLIDVTETIGNGASKTITNPGRAFKVVQVLCTGVDGTTCVVKKNTTGGAQASSCSLSAGDLNAFPSTITAADAVFAATDNIFIAVSGGAGKEVSRVTLLCEAASGQDLTVT